MIKLSNEDLERYKEKVRTAQNTPVIFMSGHSLVDTAWESVQYFMKDMAEKYGYEYLEHVINMKTGEILTIKQAQELEREQKKENDT